MSIDNNENPYAYNPGTERPEGDSWELSNVVDVPSEFEPRTPFVLYLEHRDGYSDHPCRLTAFGQYLQIEAPHFEEPLKLSREEAKQAIVFKRTKILINSHQFGKYKFRLNKKAKDLELQRARLEAWAKHPPFDDPIAGRREVDKSLVKFCSWLTASDVLALGIIQVVIFVFAVALTARIFEGRPATQEEAAARFAVALTIGLVGILAMFNFVSVVLFWKRQAWAFGFVIGLYSLALFNSLGFVGAALRLEVRPNLIGILISILVLYHAVSGMNSLKAARRQMAEENERHAYSPPRVE